MNMTERTRPILITVCVCTFRRDHVTKTIHSLDALHLPDDVRVEVIVADNDSAPSARERVADAARTIDWPVTYLHAPARNISIARNACLDHAKGDYCAFIDDDEIATRDWLGELLRIAREQDCEAVLGPVRALYDEDAPAWMREADFHSTYPVYVEGIIRTGYTCNVLIDRRSPIVEPLRFDLERGTSGGEDTDFFARLDAAGGRIAYASQAWVEEPVPRDRTSFSWLAKRRYRMGQTHGGLLLRKGRSRPKEMALVGAKVLACAALTLATMGSAAGRRRNVLRGILHVGALNGLSGGRSLTLYGGKTEPRETP